MKRICSLTALVFIIALISGCASLEKHPGALCTGPLVNGSAVEVSPDTRTPGTAAVVIKATLKTHTEGFFPLEPKSHMHGKPGFRFVVVIDDKVFEWRDHGHLEKLPFQERGKANPEGGEGIRYAIEKNFLLNPGRHRVTLKLPSEQISLTVPLELIQKAEPYVLEFKPVYNGPNTRRFGFEYGVQDMDPFLDGAPLSMCRN